MPIVEMGRAGPGFACSCPAFRRQPKNLAKTLARAASVQVEDLGVEGGVHHFRAWSGETKYRVAFDPNESGGWCKHCAACAAVLASEWLRRSYSEVAAAVGALDALGKESKRLKRESAKLTKSIEKRG